MVNAFLKAQGHLVLEFLTDACRAARAGLLAPALLPSWLPLNQVSLSNRPCLRTRCALTSRFTRLPVLFELTYKV